MPTIGGLLSKVFFTRFILDSDLPHTQSLFSIALMDSAENWKLGLGLVIRNLRKERDWTQENLAYEAGLTRYAIQKLERGAVNTAVETLVAVATALKLSPDELWVEARTLLSSPRKFAIAQSQLEEERKTGRPKRATMEAKKKHVDVKLRPTG